MISVFWLALWLQMSTPAPCQSAKLYYDGVLVDEEPHCGLLNQVTNMPTALDDMTRAEFAEAAQRAADETDGLHECKDEADSNCLQAKCCDEKVKGADETDGKPPTIEWIQTTDEIWNMGEGAER